MDSSRRNTTTTKIFRDDERQPTHIESLNGRPTFESSFSSTAPLVDRIIWYDRRTGSLGFGRTYGQYSLNGRPRQEGKVSDFYRKNHR